MSIYTYAYNIKYKLCLQTDIEYLSIVFRKQTRLHPLLFPTLLKSYFVTVILKIACILYIFNMNWYIIIVMSFIDIIYSKRYSQFLSLLSYF